jgi:hypothetical protein
MSVLNEGKHAAEFLLSEGNGTISRDEVTIAAAAGAIEPGTVLGKLANGKYVAYANGASDGSEVAAGIALYAIPDSAADQKAVAIRRFAEVQKDRLVGLDAAGEADLAALGVIAR